MRHIDMPKTGRSRGKLGAILLAAALVAVSCGSDDKGSATPTAGGTAAPAPAETTAAAPADTTAAAPADTTATPVGDKVTDFAAYIGGTGAAEDRKSVV